MATGLFDPWQRANRTTLVAEDTFKTAGAQLVDGDICRAPAVLKVSSATNVVRFARCQGSNKPVAMLSAPFEVD